MYSILSIDDEPFFCDLAVHLQKKNGEMDVYCTDSVLAAIRMVEQKGSISDLIPPDIREPDLNAVIDSRDRNADDPSQEEDFLIQAFRMLQLLNQLSGHDIGNHLTNMLCSLSLIDRAELSKESHEYFRVIQRSAVRIKREMAFISQFQDPDSFLPRWINVRNSFLQNSDMIQQNDVILNCQIQDTLELYAVPLFCKVCENLIDNALRHGNNVKEIICSARIRPPGLVISISDDGAGVPATEKELIFTREYGQNTGLGLFLSREILSLTGISIKETGEAGKGACFELIIPRNRFRITGRQLEMNYRDNNYS